MKHVVALGCLASAALFGVGTHMGCSSTEATAFSELNMDAGPAPVSDATVVAVCPTDATPPAPNSACNLPDGTTCFLGKCSDTLASCQLGKWQFSKVQPPAPRCPMFVPALGEQCPPCWPENLVCTYGCFGDAGALPSAATCTTDGWTAVDAGCPAPGDASRE